MPESNGKDDQRAQTENAQIDMEIEAQFVHLPDKEQAATVTIFEIVARGTRQR